METESEVKFRQNMLLVIPISIVIAGALIAIALFASRSSGNIANNNNGSNPQAEVSGDLEKIDPITNEDHIRGNPDASVTIVEYSDTECPFCKRFHETMKELVATDFDVAWVYRHFPLDQLHSKARKEAEATECAAELGGNEGFWAYLDRLMEVTPANHGLDPAELPNIAEFVGLDRGVFNECLESGKYADKIEKHVQNAVATGGRGTPWSIIVSKNGKKLPLSGAQPLEAVKQLLEVARQNK